MPSGSNEEVAHVVGDALKAAGLSTEWNDSLTTRIKVNMQWQNRLN